jgi:exodeoxyribonuclease-5
MQLSAEQERARAAILSWYRSSDRKPWFLVEGPAGSGKSSVITATTDSIDGKVLYAAPTGRAALVMRKKGCPHAMTLHSLLYTPKGMGGNRKQVELLRDLQSGKDVKAQLMSMLQAELVVLEAQFEIDRKNNSNCREPGRIKSIKDALKSGLTQLGDLVSASPLFQLNPESALKDADLLVIDESSMVPEAVLQDALSFGVPILLQGDRNQLPPVKSTSPLLTTAPDFSLQEVHRQAKDSPIIYLATLARLGKSLPLGTHGNCLVTQDACEEEAMAADQIIVGTHKRRWAVNDRAREIMGYKGIFPNIGERVICRSNDHKVGLLNGEQFKVTFFKEGKYSSRIGVSNDELSTIQSCHNDYFHHKEPNPYTKKSAQCFDFGWSITCHSAQGGQFPSVYVVDESRKFGADRNRWLYTAATRPSEKLVVRI